jgi:transcriptional regulator with XRE-family HTH domain
MASTLQELRREAGYDTAKEFAEELGISPATYSRYEQKPENIPTPAAWKLADHLGCSIDAVVGREHISVEDMRGPQQRFYDGLSRDGRRLMNEFMEFVEQREKKSAASRARRERMRYDNACANYLRLFYAELQHQAGAGEIVEFATFQEERARFHAFLKATLGNGDDEKLEVIDKLMEAFDRTNDEFDFDDMRVRAHMTDLRGLDIEFDSGE